jgi:hypothetical protein
VAFNAALGAAPATGPGPDAADCAAATRAMDPADLRPQKPTISQMTRENPSRGKKIFRSLSMNQRNHENILPTSTLCRPSRIPRGIDFGSPFSFKLHLPSQERHPLRE